MATPAQIEANRKNSKQSTGPTSAEGKTVASRNSLKHGILSQQVLLPNEDARAFAQLSKRLRSQMKPVGEFEKFLVQRIAELAWSLEFLSA